MNRILSCIGYPIFGALCSAFIFINLYSPQKGKLYILFGVLFVLFVWGIKVVSRFNLGINLLIALFLIFGISIRFWWSLYSGVEQTSDSIQYINTAFGMLDGQGILSLYKQPGPAMMSAISIWLFGNWKLAPEFMVAFFSSLELVLVFMLSLSLFGKKMALAALGIFMILPEHIIYSNIVSASLYQGTWLLLSLYIFILSRNKEGRWGILIALFSGCVFGISQYMRASSMFLMIFFFSYLFIFNIMRKKILFACMGFVIACTPILIFNYDKLGIVSFSPSQYSGYSLLIGTNLEHKGHYFPTAGEMVDRKVKEKIELGEISSIQADDALVRNKVATKMAIQQVLEEPLAFIINALKYKMSIFWGEGASFYWSLEGTWLKDKYSALSLGLAYLNEIYVRFLLLIMLFAVFLLRRPVGVEENILLGLMFSTFAIAGTHMIAEIQSKYHLVVIWIYPMMGGFFAMNHRALVQKKWFKLTILRIKSSLSAKS